MPDQYLRTIRHFNRDIRLYLFASGLVGFCLFSGIYSLLFNLYLLRLGYGPAFVGQVNAVGGLAFALSSLPSSFLGSRWGNRRTMILGLGLATVGHALLSQAEFVPNIHRQSFILSMNSLGLLGISLYIVNGYPYLMRVSSAAQRHHVFSLQAALFPLAGFAGSLVGGFLPGGFAGPLTTFPRPSRPLSAYIAPAPPCYLPPGVFALVATGRETREHHEDTPTDAAPLPLKLILVISFIAFLYTASEGAVRTFLNVYLDDALNASTALIGTLAASGQLLAIPAALMMPFLVQRFGRTRTFNGAVFVLGSDIGPPRFNSPLGHCRFMPYGHYVPSGDPPTGLHRFPTRNDATALADRDGRGSGYNDRLWLCRAYR